MEKAFQKKWPKIKSQVGKKWHRLTVAEINEMEGTFEELKQMLERKYGYQRHQAELEVYNFLEENGLTDEEVEGIST